MRESLSQPGDFVLSVLNDQPKAGPGSPLRVTHIKVMCEVSQPGCGVASRWSFSGLKAGGATRGDSALKGGLTWCPFRVDAILWVAQRRLTASQTWWSTSRRQGLRRPRVPLSTCGR